MPIWWTSTTDLLWRNAMTVIPLALIAWAICRWVPCRAATRHSIWLCVLVSLIVGPLLPPLSGVDSTSDATTTTKQVADAVDDNTPALADSRTPTPPRMKARAETPVSSRLRHATGSAGPSSDLGSEGRDGSFTPATEALVDELPVGPLAATDDTATQAWPWHPRSTPSSDVHSTGYADRFLTGTALTDGDGFGDGDAVSGTVVRDGNLAPVTTHVASVPRGRRGHGARVPASDTLRDRYPAPTVEALAGKPPVAPHADEPPVAPLAATDDTATQAWPWHPRGTPVSDVHSTGHADRFLTGAALIDGDGFGDGEAVPANVVRDGNLAPAGSPSGTAEALAGKPPVAPSDRTVVAAGIEGEVTSPSVAPLPDVESPFSSSVLPAVRPLIEPWIIGLVTVRDAIGNLPKMPSTVWVGGIVLVVMLRVRQTLRYRRLVHAGISAPASVRQMVEETATSIGLRNTPRTIMVRDRISPMVWCGRELCLVLPRGLWSELDELGRRAVLSHELAHIRRRDHWVCWFESIFGALYWWHPLVWWVRSHLRDEAENCCDAWVTWLLPRSRRMYAEALLQTRQFVGEVPQRAPTGTIGAITGKTKRFARRLTMVMTKRETPNLSVTGVALAITLVAIGWIATPAQSQEAVTTTDGTSAVSVRTAAVSGTTAVKASGGASSATCATDPGGKTKVRRVILGPKGQCEAKCGKAKAAACGGTASAKLHAGHPGREFEERMARLERQLAELERAMERINQHAHLLQEHGMPPMPEMPVMPEMPAMPEMLGMPPMPGMPLMAEMQRMPRGASLVGGGDTTVRLYQLPPKSLDALTELMVREDVPILVSPTENGLKVHGTAEQHGIFAAFVEIITKKGETRVDYALPEGKLEALTELMANKEVPVVVTPGKKAIKVHGQPATQAVFKAFVEMIHPPKGAKGGGGYAVASNAAMEKAAQQYTDRIQRESERQAHLAAEQAERAAYAKHVREARMHTMRQNQAHLREIHRGMRDRQRHAARLERKAERLEDEADRIFDKVDRLRDMAEDESNPEKVHRYELAAAEAARKAEAMMEESRVMLEHAESLEAEAEALEEQADELEAEIDEHESADFDDEYAEHDEGEEDEDFDEEFEEEEDEELDEI